MAKRKSRAHFHECGDPEEIDRIHSEAFPEEEFNPVKLENEPISPEEEKVLEETKIKKTFPYDRARLEYMRMQIGPVQNFYTTLGNVLLSLSERLRVLEEELLKLKVKDSLWEKYYGLMNEQKKFLTVDDFLIYLKQKEAEKNAPQKS